MPTFNMQPNGKRCARAVQKMLIFEAGLAVAEMLQARLRTLEAKVYREYATRLRMFDPRSEDTLEAFLSDFAREYQINKDS